MLPHRTLAARRIMAAALLAAVIATGLFVHGVLPDTDATDIAGDALYAAAVYFFITAIAPSLKPLTVGAIAATWCVAIELFQLTGIPLALGSVFSPIMLVLGTVFDARDLVVYVLTIAVVTALDAVFSRRRVAVAQTPPAQ